MAMMQHQHMGQHSSMRRVAPAPTGPDTRATSEQYPEVDFLTLVGSLHALEIVIEQWAPLVGAANFQSTTLPRILALPSATQEYASQALRVAVVRHEANLGPTLVTRLRTQLNLFQIADVVVEEGYFLSSAGPPSGNHDQLDMVDSWSVRWETRHLDALCRRFEVPLVPDLLRGRVYWSLGIPSQGCADRHRRRGCRNSDRL